MGILTKLFLNIQRYSHGRISNSISLNSRLYRINEMDILKNITDLGACGYAYR